MLYLVISKAQLNLKIIWFQIFGINVDNSQVKIFKYL